ncbi:MAG: SPRY domain-containing protein [Negativicutes bacterium]
MSLDIITYSKLKAVVKQLTQTIADSVYVHPTGDGNKHVPSTAEVLEGTPTTWDPLAKHASAVLSNGNLTVSSGIAQWCGARATVSKATGKYYFEVLCNAIDSVSVGICTVNSDFSFVGNSGSSGGVLSNGGEVFFTGGSPSYGDPLWIAGDVIGVAVDMDATSVICYLNNVQIASNNFDPSKSPIFPMVACVNNGVATGRFTATDLTYSPPAGYTAWGDETVIPDANEGKVLTAGDEPGEFSWQALPTAAESLAGVVELATEAEAVAGTDTARAVTPAGLSTSLDARTLGLLNIASLPAHYERSNKWANGGSGNEAARRTMVSPARLTVNVNDAGYLLPSALSLDLGTAANWDSTAANYTVAANRAGKDFYIYACQPVSGTVPIIKLSANSTVPTGYTATTSRKIGGFHCLCVAVGTIAGHTLTGYLAGDILPTTVWDLKHRPSCTPEGMAYVEQLDLWVDIYLQSGTGATTKSANNAVITDTRIWNDHVDDLAAVGKRLLDDSEFQIAAEGCNQQTNIVGSADPNTTGGHVDTASRRMLSNAGLEDCAGVLYQWLRDQSYQFQGAASHTHSVTVSGDAQTVTTENPSGDVAPAFAWYALPGGKGQLYRQGTYGDAKLLAGMYWAYGAYCGSRGRVANYYRWSVSAGIGARGRAEPKRSA